MSFVNPTYLWAFLGLLVPIAIHLWSNREGKVIKVGSIKFLENSESSQSKSIKLNEYFLLFLRLLLLSLLVLILAEPQIHQNSKKSSLTYLIEPSLLKNNMVKSVIDNVNSNQEIRVFTEDFPEVKDFEENSSSIPNYWQLTEQLETLKTDSIVVFTKGFLAGIKGKRPSLNILVKWIVLEDKQTVNDEPILAFKDEGEISIIKANSSASYLSFNNQKLALNSNQIKISNTQDSLIVNGKTIPLKYRKKTRVLIVYNEKLESQLYYLEASIKAIEKYSEQTIQLEKVNNVNGVKLDDYDLIVWLDEEQNPKTKTTILKYYPDNLALNIIEESEVKNVFHLTEKLSTRIMLNHDFTSQLFKLLYDFQIDESILNTIDKRVISESEIQTDFVKKQTNINKLNTKDYTKWLWLPFLFILVLERIVATVRKQ